MPRCCQLTSCAPGRIFFHRSSATSGWFGNSARAWDSYEAMRPFGCWKDVERCSRKLPWVLESINIWKVYYFFICFNISCFSDNAAFLNYTLPVLESSTDLSSGLPRFTLVNSMHHTLLVCTATFFLPDLLFQTHYFLRLRTLSMVELLP